MVCACREATWLRPGFPHVRLRRTIISPLARLRAWEVATRLSNPEARAALARRWSALPESVRTPSQVIGRAAVGCEGTQGVFPQCNLTCSPCYHSADANKVRVDADHTLRQVTEQMALLRQLRGPRAHAQLIGGEVSLLAPEAHAEALLAMRAAGREPMSMTHGDFDPAYLEAIVTGPDGQLRLPRVSFAAHFDSLMRGRRGMPRPRRESDLHEHRRAFAAMFQDLRRRRGLRSYLAHTMTITSENLEQVAELVRSVPAMGYSMMSFQPAARVGDPRRWDDDDPGVSIEQVWRRIEDGLGQSISWGALSFGHPQCNRTAFGLRVGERWIPLLDPESAGDLALRDRYLTDYGSLQRDPERPALVVLQAARALLGRPRDVRTALAWSSRLVERCGGLPLLMGHLVRREVKVLTFVVHAFMDASVVKPAWEQLQSGRQADDPFIREAQERLMACVYSMAHPETGEIVPACVQHSVLDPDANRHLAVLLPHPTIRPTLREDVARPGTRTGEAP